MTSVNSSVKVNLVSNEFICIISSLSTAESLATVCSVSYTHLDVYKRQRDNLYVLRVDDALYLILRQAAAVLEGDGQRNVVDAVDRNRNLDLFGLRCV